MKLQFNYRAHRLLIHTISLIIPLFLFFPLYIFAEVVDKVVAVVNDDVITLSELEEEAAVLYQTVARAKSDKPLIEALAEAREMTLDKMIDQHLIAQRAKEYNVSVTEEEIDSAYSAMRTKMSLSPSEFRQKLR